MRKRGRLVVAGAIAASLAVGVVAAPVLAPEWFGPEGSAWGAVFDGAASGLVNCVASVSAWAQGMWTRWWPWAVGALALIVVGWLARVRLRRGPVRDPQRSFTPAQRSWGFERAGWRCEQERWLQRCPRPASEGDHYVPWTTGGATSMGNFVASCWQCNVAKGARVPGLLARRRLERRRRRYFPAGEPRRAGERWSRNAGRARVP